LHHINMAPFGILEAGFCMVFRPASFCFWAPGVHFWTPEPKCGPGEVLGGNTGVEKNWFCGGLVLKTEIGGFPVTQMDCMVHRRCLGKPVFPKTSLKICFPDFSQFSGNWGRVPLAPCGSPIGPLWSPPGLVAWPKAPCIRRTSSEVAGRVKSLQKQKHNAWRR